jgi:hypothetical protein
MNTNLLNTVRLCTVSMLVLGSSLFAGEKSDNFEALKNKKSTPFFLNDWKEIRGKQGERGKNGKRGKRGKRGKNGKDGAAFVSAYASVYTQAIWPVTASANFLFPNVSGDNNVDTSLAASQGKLVIQQDGDYAVRFTVVPYNSSAKVAVLKNGGVVPGSRVDVGPFNQRYTVANECIITLKKGDYIQLQNVGEASITFNDEPPVHTTAELTIQKL